MAQAQDQGLTEKFVQFYRNYYREQIGELAQKYPKEKRSLYVDYDDLYTYDADLAEDYLNQPEQLQEHAEEALRLYDLPADVKLGRAHVRLVNIPETVDIRDIRVEDDHIGRLVAVQGIIRKATDVRPKITEAAFECQRCGTMTYIPQSDSGFQEPHECQGCERQGPFRVNFDQSEFIDSQKLRVQESPEGLRGGETPQSIDVNIEDDVTGKVTPGDHVTVVGVLHIEQQSSNNEKTPIFDLYMDGVSITVEDEEFEDMEITEADKLDIVELSESEDIYERMVRSVAPSIYGYEQEKLAMVLQLFSGVTKHLPDGSRIRGDLHMLLIGDPGTGKCVAGDTRVTLADGSEVPIRELVEENLTEPKPVDDGVYDDVSFAVPSLQQDGSLDSQRATKVWKREAPDTMYRIRTSGGRELEVTPSHPLFVQSEGSFEPVVAEELSAGDFVAVPRRLPSVGDDQLDVKPNTNLDVIPAVGETLRRVRERLRLSQFDCGVPRSTYQHYERGDRNPSQTKLRTVVERFEDRIEWLRDVRERVDSGSWDDVEALRDELNVSQQELAQNTDVTQTAISDDERREAVPDGGQVQGALDVIEARIDEALSVTDEVERLRALVESDVGWERIEVKEAVAPADDWVYDLEVEGTHNYLSNGVVSHNSQLLQYIRNIAPRSVYTSGKGSSSAGLTAAAVRDDFGDGQQWTLEAGALVLADKGIAAVDELDKMRCVTGDSLVHLHEGGIRRIRDLAHDAAREGTIEELPNGRTIRNVDAEAWTMTDDGRLVTRPVAAIHEYDAPAELTRVTLESGEQLTAIHDHPFITFEGGERVEKPAADVSPGDWVYVPRHLSRKAADGGVQTVHSAAGPADAVAEDELPPALAAVLGYLSGDGNVYYDREAGVYGIRFTNKEAELLADFEQVCQEAFDAEPIRAPSERREDGVETVRLPGREYADEVLDAGMNLETYDGKAFPAAVSEASSAAKAAFVRAMADSEGDVDTSSGNVRISSSSYELLLGVKSLLLEFGVSSQIQHRERSDRRDLYVLAVTAADSLRQFNRHVGFTLSRKQSALDEVCESTAGDRTILDVIPNCGDLLASLRESLRLHVSECGLVDATYCDFENGEANVSLSCARSVLDTFERRMSEAESDMDRLAGPCDWETLSDIKERYHVSQDELADGTSFSQQQVSRLWGDDEALETAVRGRLQEIVEAVADTDLDRYRQLVRGDVKWRRVETVTTVDEASGDDRVRVLKHELADVIGVETEAAVESARRLLDSDPNADDWDDLRGELERHGVSYADVARDLNVASSTVSRWFNGAVDTDRFDDVVEAACARFATVRDEVRRRLEAIESRDEPKVYDLTVEGTHNFVANGMVVHNSEDRSAMHEGLEQQQISVSKAGINATLKSRCSLLGAANPKYGRFDQYEPIGEQIDLEPALISRFDIIFTVTDQPDPDRDADLADHIIQTNYAGELNTQRTKVANSNFTQEEVDGVTEEVEPDIAPELLRKYVAYAKRTCYPTMTDEAKAAIRDFYVDLRAKGQGEDAPVPVTARKLEALVRLAEASARVRLSDYVEQGDAERVIEIVRTSLQDIGVDPETGQFDADVIETGQSKSQRDRIKNLKQLIKDIEDDYEEGAPVEEVLERADEIGLDRTKAEGEIEKLRRKGEVYEPRQDHLRTT